MQSGTCGKNLAWELDDNGTLTISGEGVMEDSGWIFGKTPWRKYDKFIEKIVIERGVKSVGEAAFRSCENLTSVTIPVGVKTIGSFAFTECDRLTNVTIPDGVKSIESMAFAWCRGLTILTIPVSVKSIGIGAFTGCYRLQAIYCGAGLSPKLQKLLLGGNDAKILPYGATFIPPAVVKEVATSYGATFIPHKPTFDKNLRWKVDGHTLTVGGVRVIKNFSAVEPPWVDNLRDILNIVIENGVEEISAHAFEDCKRLEQVTFPASVKTVGDFAFTICYCGDKRVNGGRNVFWSLNDGILTLKKNPAAKVDADFSTGFVTWLPLERNITGVRLDDGVKPTEKFLTWLMRRTVGKQISFG